MATFAYTIWPSREGFGPDSATSEELAAVGEHWNYLVQLNEAGSILFVGRTNSEPFIGNCVFSAVDLDAANGVAMADPAVQKGVFNMRCQPYSIFFPEALKS